MNNLKTDARDRMTAWLFLFPGLLILLFSYVYPLLYSLKLSFSSWDMLDLSSSMQWNGFGNYVRVLSEPKFLDSLVRTLLFAGGALFLQIFLGMVTALWATNENLSSRFTRIVRGMILAPMIISPIVAGILWRILYSVEYGPINAVLGWFGIEQRLWIADQGSALFSVMLVEVWANTSFVTIILVGALLSMSHEPNQAAQVDGANTWQTFYHVTLPQLKPVLMIVALLRIMDLFKGFDFIYSMTYGGPGDSTEVLTMFIYKQGIKFLDMTGAAASSWVLMILLMPFSIYLLRKTLASDSQNG
ncbi:carbohydrate ABC transporter permease [Paenibacillus nasutitermitis]|uniref:ABC transporter permease n=1 Tax=Paenibacillus nasutitermitis TaxID=1652958 RepID=A0A916ZI71_9BACL|nr:sugar ABC transporter permease [Paenibacillus nasutitermitis]GGD99156.1 ABC transporter permease [Paenibacillus nasutitermitis]